MSKFLKLGSLFASVFVFVAVACAYSFDLLPNVANTYSVGSTTLYWKDFYSAVTHIQSGTNKKGGTVTINGVTPVTVANTSITANSVVVFSLKTVGGTVGAIPTVKTTTPTTGFTVAGTAADTSIYNYAVVELF